LTPPQHDIVDRGAFYEVTFFCISPRNLLGDFFYSLNARLQREPPAIRCKPWLALAVQKTIQHFSQAKQPFLIHDLNIVTRILRFLYHSCLNEHTELVRFNQNKVGEIIFYFFAVIIVVYPRIEIELPSLQFRVKPKAYLC
jgi:hypothetical protein